MKVEIKERGGEVKKVRIFIGEKRYDITEGFGKLNILSNGKLSVFPCVSNVIELDTEEE